MSDRKETIVYDRTKIQTANDLAERFYNFTEGIRVLFLIQRSSDGGHTNNSKIRKYITRNETEWIEALAKLMEEQEEKNKQGIELRIYQSLNDRDIKKAIRQFKQLQLDADYLDEENKEWFYLDIKNRMVSALMKPSSKNSSYFLIDCDISDLSTDEFGEIQGKLSNLTQIIDGYPSKNGYHWIVNPFNPQLFKHRDCSVNKDALMLLKF